MSRKHCKRKVVQPLPPRGLRPKLAPEQVRDLSIVHIEQLDAISRGQADAGTLWSAFGGVLTWHRVAVKLGIGEPEMAAQLDVLARVVERFGRTGKVGFSGPEYQLAKEGVEVMDQLAALVDQPTAAEAAEWSERRVQKTADEAARLQQLKVAA
jgi:hypothetical protein